MKLDKGHSKNHHVIRPRNVDLTKRLLVSSEKEDFSAEMRVPHCAPIEVPKIEDIPPRKSAKKPFKLPAHYLRYSLLPCDQLENIIDYELTNADFEWIETCKLPKACTQPIATRLLEQSFVTWENDTNKGQIIPWERALYLVREQNYLEENSSEDFNKFFETLFKYWLEQRREMGRPLIRRYWKSEGINDSQIKIAFQPRSHYKEKRKTRNSKKNDQETLDKMKCLTKHFEMLLSLAKGTWLRENLKKNRLELTIAAFEQERADRISKSSTGFTPDDSQVEASKEFRKSYNFVESSYLPLPVETVLQSVPVLLERVESERPIKRFRSEIPVTKKKELSHEIARACCFLIAEGEKLQKWPFIDRNNRSQGEVRGNTSSINQASYERSVKMRGRISRCGSRIVIDRLSNNDYQHMWGRYLGLHGVWHSFDSENMQDEYDNDDTEALIRAQKLILQNFRPNANKIKK